MTQPQEEQQPRVVIRDKRRIDPTSGTVESLCLHGDSAGAVDLALRVRRALTDAGIALAGFSRPGP